MTSLSKSKLVEWIAGVFILLFVYTAVSKLLSFRQFQNTLHRSPLISQFADFIAVALPAIELLIAVLLLNPQWRAKGLSASLVIMIVFTLYIGYMILFTPHLPCSCGGVIKQLGWRGHLIFNGCFILLAFITIYLNRSIHIQNQ